MCGRINLTIPSIQEVAEAVQATLEPTDAEGYHPRYNIAPTNVHWQLVPRGGARQLERARWGLQRIIGPGERKLLINARSENIDGRAWVSAFRARRSVVPSTGYYEWSGTAGARRPLWFHPPRGGLLWLAALWDPPEPSEGDALPGFTILTCHPNEMAARVHDRMPCILGEAEIEAWLTAPDPALLRPPPEEALVAVPVSRRLNDVRNDEPSCLAPEAGEQQGFAFAEVSAAAPSPRRAPRRSSTRRPS